MQSDYWLKQANDKPLYPDLLWSRPENRLHAGKLLIVGGHLQAFSTVAEAYSLSLQAGAGATRVVLPDALYKTVGKIFPEAEFVASTPSGSFAQKSLAELLAAASWADGVLLAGDLGRNSETAILLEKFTSKYLGQLTLAGDSLDYFLNAPNILERANSTMLLTTSQLQKIAISAKFDQAFTSTMSVVNLAETLHDFTTRFVINIITSHADNLLAAGQGKLSSTKPDSNLGKWQNQLAPAVSVWWLQNPDQTFEALTTAIYDKFLAE